jgi:hypothetical protein
MGLSSKAIEPLSSLLSELQPATGVSLGCEEVNRRLRTRDEVAPAK